jgi:hypothetical protein
MCCALCGQYLRLSACGRELLNAEGCEIKLLGEN